MRKQTRRCFSVALASAAAASILPWQMAQAADPVKFALIAPLSGPWARQGETMKKGIELAVADVNAAGGIKALGGAKLELVVADAGDSAEKAKNAAQRLIAQEPALVAGQGAWLSSFTLAVTEVTERAGLPWLTLSFADPITARGFKYVFQDSALASTMAKNMLPTVVALAEAASGTKPKSTAIVADNTAAAIAFLPPFRAGLAGMGVENISDVTFSPPLSDATGLVQPLRRRMPDFLMLSTSNVPDAKQVLEKLKEFNLTTSKMPIMSFGAHMTTPELHKVVGAELLEGVFVLVANHASKGHEEIVKRFKAATGEPWMTQDSISAYAEVMVLKEALEMAKSTDREAVAKALRTMDLTDGPAAKLLPGGRVKFDEAGRRVGAGVVIVQWQKGEPMTVWPPELARAKPYWPKS